jgi:hypothetical protein
MGAIKEVHHNEIEKGQRAAIDDTWDYPILFDTQMVRAILSGEKTQTRRLFKSPLSKAMEPAHEIWQDGGEWIARLKNGQCYKPNIVCPYGEPGDLLWVKETWALALSDIAYKADYSKQVLSEPKNKGVWHPSIHMAKKDSRLWLQITDIKAQRIQSITEDEAKAEGVDIASVLNFSPESKHCFRSGFYKKWEKIYGIESWFENQWVWAIKFEVYSTQNKSI